MKNFLKSGATALAAASLVLTAAGTAQAATAKVDDAKNDVWRYDGSTDSYSKARSPMNADLVKTVVKHNKRKLKVTASFKRLSKQGDGFQSLVYLKNRSGDQYVAIAYAGPGAWNGEHGFYTLSGPQSGRAPAARGGAECANMTHSMNYRKDTVTFTIPRRCYDSAKKIRAKSMAYAYNGERSFQDNGHNRGHGQKGWTRLLKAG